MNINFIIFLALMLEMIVPGSLEKIINTSNYNI